MVHKTNNSQPVLEQTPFDALLRRQLQYDGARAVPCAGFDVDTATAYLERALLAAAQQTFEGHLADCTGCRQHVTALMMLNEQLAPALIEMPAPRAMQLAQPSLAQPSLWARLSAPFNEWRTSFDLNWGFASAGAAMAALLVTFTIYSWRNEAGNQAPLASATVAAEVANATQPVALPAESTASALLETSTNAPLLLAATTSTASKAGESSGSAEGLMAKRDAVSAAPPALPPLPGPRIALATSGFAAGSPAAAAPIRVLDVPEEVVALNGSKVASPTLPRADFFGSNFAGSNGIQGTPVSLGSNGNQNGGLMPVGLNSIEPTTTVSSLNVMKHQLERQSRMADLAAVDSAKPVDREAADKNNEKAGKNETSLPRAIINGLKGQRPGLSFMPGKGTEARTKEAEKTADEPLAKPLTKRVNGHTFYFERGYWIDENYRSDTTLPLVKLVRGSERYQNLLIEHPTLEQFFQLGQVIVVWKNKVYEVKK
ncbi:MAG: hypothetical protein HOP19_23980 [Acidobacteria bacterium]|nr:hypothetical protein [Acidobacteriota bacterium]